MKKAKKTDDPTTYKILKQDLESVLFTVNTGEYIEVIRKKLSPNDPTRYSKNDIKKILEKDVLTPTEQGALREARLELIKSNTPKPKIDNSYSQHSNRLHHKPSGTGAMSGATSKDTQVKATK